jgi:hypothetical protein
MRKSFESVRFDRSPDRTGIGTFLDVFRKTVIRIYEWGNHMCVAFYSEKSENEGKKLVARIRDSVPGQKIRILRKVETLAGSLSHCESPDIALFLPADKEELSSILRLKKSLEGSRIILILPDRTVESLKSARALSPLLTCFRDGDITEPVAVVARLRNEELAETEVHNPKSFWQGREFPYVSPY